MRRFGTLVLTMPNGSAVTPSFKLPPTTVSVAYRTPTTFDGNLSLSCIITHPDVAQTVASINTAVAAGVLGKATFDDSTSTGAPSAFLHPLVDFHMGATSNQTANRTIVVLYSYTDD